jgi:two-component system chemotaxis response regulator CheY
VKVLIVDDSNMIRQRIARLINDPRLENVEVIGQACNGSEALEMFSRAAPDLVTMDLTMPKLSGVECTEEMVSRKPDILILVVSALSDKATALRALKKGAQGFLYKPFTDDQLVSALQEVMRP